MPRFCNACGTRNEDDAAFCDDCGVPLRRPMAATAPATAPAPAPAAPPIAAQTRSARRVPRAALWGGVGAVGLALVVGLGAWAWTALRHGPPNAAEQQAVAERWLQGQQDRLLRGTCLSNFPYRQSTVSVAGWNSDTKAWLDALVAGGVYQANGNDAYGNWLYAHGPEAQRHIRRGQLCLANAVKLSQTALKSPSAQEQALLDRVPDGRRFAQITVTYAWDALPAFATQPPVADEWPSAMKNTTAEVLLFRDDERGWREATASDERRLNEQVAALDAPARGNTQAQAGGGFDLGAWFSRLFSFGSGPDRVAEQFMRSVAEGNVEAAVAHLHPAQRSQATDAKIGMAIAMKTQERGTTAPSIDRIETEVERQTEESATVRVVVHYANGRNDRDRMQLRRHDGRWYVWMN